MVPPSGQTFDNRNFDQWVSNDTYATYGYTPSIYLGLAKPGSAKYNADNYAILGICMRYVELDCLGTFQDQIRSGKERRGLPFQISWRTVEKIRSGEVDLTNM